MEFCLNLSVMDGIKTPCSIAASTHTHTHTHRSPSTQMRCVCTGEQTALSPKLSRPVHAQNKPKNQGTKLRRGLTNVAIYYHQVVTHKKKPVRLILAAAKLEVMAVPRCFLTLQRSGRESGDCTLQPGHLLPYPNKKKRKNRNRRRNTQNPRDVYCRIASRQNETTCSDTEKTDWSLMWTSEIQQTWRLVIFHRCDYCCSIPQILQTNLFVGHRRHTSRVNCHRNCSAGVKNTHNLKKKKKNQSLTPFKYHPDTTPPDP